ncbi:UbiA-like protein EboC [Pontibacter sp. G13]|uniref:UbiA-like protein EboC n=1 Tax=Pontibacter sp. G13 TaxID=3074898 RepID=UPI00288A1F1B|nr:UbiA-like protein EboC [Pontibacter sp. G13]WNJ20607.1 UbiA-like protein EboC [Pontibacter sp. G13]
MPESPSETGKTILGYLRLLRPPNILTAWADILAGTAIAGAWAVHDGWPILEVGSIGQICWLVLATTGLYGGGVVLNDYFDADLDAEERPERPIPSGAVSKRGAGIWGATWMLTGIFAAFQAGMISGWIASIIALLVVLYDSWGKHQPILGPINMGMCRGFNLLLGVSLVTAALIPKLWMGLIPIVYIGAITLISRGEVHGGNRRHLNLALGLYALVVLAIFGIGIQSVAQPWAFVPFTLLFAYWVFPPVWKARQTPNAGNVMKAVKAGVIALIMLNAAIAACFAGWIFALGILLLLPLSMGLARLFAVT